jgi:hypothetical protein
MRKPCACDVTVELTCRTALWWLLLLLLLPVCAVAVRKRICTHWTSPMESWPNGFQ